MANQIFIRQNDSVHMVDELGEYTLLEKTQVNGVWLFLTERAEENLKRMGNSGLANQINGNWTFEENPEACDYFSLNKFEHLEESVADVIDVFNEISSDLKRRNSLTVLAQKFNGYERLCLQLANKGISEQLEPGTRVIFIETKEKGTVSSINESFVFVKFDRLIPDTGIDDTTGQACSRDQLMILE